MEAKTISKVPTPDGESPIMEASRMQGEIKRINDELKVRQAEADRMFQEINADLIEDLESAIKGYRNAVDRAVESNLFEEGRYRIVNKARQTRTVNIERFRQAFPEVFDQIVEVRVQKAENAIGKNQLAPLCDIVQGPDQWELTVEIKKGAKS